jgi:hypothetical protein
VGYLRLRCQYAENGRINVIFGDAANIHKLFQSVFIGYIAGGFPGEQGERMAQWKI